MARQLGCGQVPPRLFLHEFLKPREDIKESMQARRIFEYKCSMTFYAPKPFVPITLAHASFVLGSKNFMIISSMCQYILSVLN
jgi:hypothetical protein